MDELDQLRIEHATGALEKGHAGFRAQPSASYYNIWSARMLLISTKLKCNGELPLDDVHALVHETIDATTKHGVRLALEKQNDILILALAAGDVEGARQLASIDCSTDDSHSFDVSLNCRLLAFFFNVNSETTYKPTTTERGLFGDLDAIAAHRETDLSGADRYWSSTRSKRYANTAFGNKNLFRPALEQLRSM